MKKRFLALLLAGMMAVSLAACGGSADTDPGEDTSEPTEEISGIPADQLKLGLILEGDDADDTCSRDHIKGLRQACEALGIDYASQVEVRTGVGADASCTDVINELTEDGCQAIFAGSFDHEPYIIEAASRYPDVQFFHASGYQCATDNLDNTHNYFAKIYQARYLSGIVAGLKTETNKLGYVAAKPFAEVISGFTAFYLGAKSVNPGVTMLVSYTNEWSDADQEAVTAQALIDQGCDVISHHTNTTAPVLTAETNGVSAVGYNSDALSAAPGAVLVSAMINWGSYYEHALDCLIRGEAIEQDWCGDYSEGSCCLSPFNEDIIAPGTREAVETAADGIADGSVQVFAGPLHCIDADGHELNLARGEAYIENETSSAPAFAFIVDGITVLP